MKLEHTINTTKRNSKSVDAEDFFETQDNTIDILYNNYYKNLSDIDYFTFLDFSMGYGAILKRLNILNPNVKVYGSDLIDRIGNQTCDMLDLENGKSKIFNYYIKDKNGLIHIVMNPPFNLLTKTLDYYLELKSKYPNIKSISILHSLRALEGKRRHEILDKYGYPSLILHMTKRQGFNTYFNDKVHTWTPPFSCVWSIWDDNSSLESGHTRLKYIKD